MSLDDKMAAALEASKKNPARPAGEKSLVNLIIDNWDSIQETREKGVTYKQIVKSMSDAGINVKYSCFLTALDRAKKKIEKNPELIKNKNINTKTETKAIIEEKPETKNEVSNKPVESSGIPRKIIGKAQAEADAQKEMFTKKTSN